VCRVGGDRWDRCFHAVESLGIELLLIEPELQLEFPAQLASLPSKALSQRQLAHPLQDAADTDLGLVDVALHLDQRRRQFCRSPIGIEKRVGGVLPALVANPAAGTLRVLDEAVTIEVSKRIDPVQRAERRR
jgi:hypothetical protein